ncbi:hypothetical protein RE476_11095 [Methanolobus mangrovi]|uniref:Uncharacterized protein n=1 Tax=Methanolobus mangrovi TaxID=3072977 RepID=A0AA51UEX6_9EURY|nr:hypothetical protein [Methanolobus mangrovi]WMW21906.1 hypothetical protein RE476_11095 [Methanolobus mangrovi]
MGTPDIDTYIKEAEVIEKMYMELLEGTTQKRIKRIDDGSTGLQNVEYRICVINSKNEILQHALLERYGNWYESCRNLVQKYTGMSRSSKYDDLAGLHETTLKLIDLKDPASNSNEKKHLRKEFIACFDAHVRILHSIGPRIASARNTHISLVAADKIYSELDEAETLYDQGSIRNSCIIAGNALERYLKMRCEVCEIELEPEDTLLAMARKLHESNKAYDFDLEMHGIIEHLVDLRDKCVNVDEGEELQEDWLRELIDRIRELTFMTFC